MRRFAVLLSARGAREIDEARAWWRERGKEAAFDDAIANALRLLEACPETGPRVQVGETWLRTTRRLLLDRVGYHLYYQVDPRGERLIVVCFWHVRRRPPAL